MPNADGRPTKSEYIQRYAVVHEPYALDMPGVVRAVYTEQPVASLRGNPWAEALGRPLSAAQWYARLRSVPKLHAGVGKLPPDERLHELAILDDWFEPNSRVVKLAVAIDRAVRGSFHRRSPLDDRLLWYIREMRSRSLKGDWVTIPRLRGTKAQMIGVLAASGNGKSSSLEAILAQYPQVVEHRAYGDREIPHRQLVHLTLDAPSGGSVKDLCKEFIRNADALLGTRYANMFGKALTKTKNDLLDGVRTIAMLHGLGVLVIDEIQHVNQFASWGEEGFVNDLVHLSNQVGVPVVLLGTPKGEELLTSDFRLIRRTLASGSHIWDPWPLGKQWERFTAELFEYQVLARPTPHTEALSTALHRASGGILGPARDLFKLAQAFALRTPEERLTVDLIEKRLLEELPALRDTLTCAGLDDIAEQLITPEQARRREDVRPIRKLKGAA